MGEKILITQPLPEVTKPFLAEKGIEPIYAYETEDWRSHADDIRALVYYSIKVDKPLMDALPALEIIGKRGAGIDSIDLSETQARNIAITNVGEGGNADSVAEQGVALLFAATRNIPVLDAATRAGRFTERFNFRLANEIVKTRLGIVGFGNIGRRVGQMFHDGFRCEIGYFDPYVTPDRAAEINPKQFSDVGELFEWATNIVIAAPLLPETRGLVGLSELTRLGSEGVVAIISRGGIVDENDLAEALTTGVIRAAGVDVYDHEPPANDHPFFGLPNIVLTPHLAGGSHQSRERSSLMVLDQVIRLLRGEDAPVLDQKLFI